MIGWEGSGLQCLCLSLPPASEVPIEGGGLGLGEGRRWGFWGR